MARLSKYKKTWQYVDIIRTLERNGMFPGYKDLVVDGVSFKWYYNSGIAAKLSEDFLKKIFPTYHKHMIVRVFDRNKQRIKTDKPLDWIEKVFGSRHPQYPYSIRLIINMKEICNHERND